MTTQALAKAKPEEKGEEPRGSAPMQLDDLHPERRAHFQELAAQARIQQAIRQHCDWLHKAGGLPTVKNKNTGRHEQMSPGTAAIAIGVGVDLGFKMNVALQKVTVIHGRTAIYGDAARALILKSGLTNPKKGGSWAEWTSGTPGRDDYTAHISAKRADTGEEMERHFSILEAKNVGLFGSDMWKKWGHMRMCRYRALGFLARDLFSDILLGLHIAEELISEAGPEVPPRPSMTDPPPEGGVPDPLFDEQPPQDEVKGDAPPFASHAEADRAIAETEGQGKLFNGKK
jgi:hypothetical protein